MPTRRSVGTPGDGGVDQLGVGVRQGVGIVAALDGTGAHDRIAEVGQVGVVELHVAAAGGVEGGELGPVARRQIGEEHVEVGVGIDVDGRPAARKWTIVGDGIDTFGVCVTTEAR